MRLHAIACDVMARPVYLLAARSPHIVDITLFERGLHNDPRNLRTRLQEAIDAVPAHAEAIVLGYGLCGGATAGIEARRVPVILPRAHDCITLFLGSRERYEAEVAGTPTYWYVGDQLERSNGSLTGAGSGIGGVGGDTDEAVEATRAMYVAKYGEDNADYLMEVMGGWKAHYGRGAFVATGVADERASEAIAREQADRRGWAFERLAGDLVLLRRLFDGEWDPADVLVLHPGERLAMSYDADIVTAVRAD
jgi:hypothetical protein